MKTLTIILCLFAFVSNAQSFYAKRYETRSKKTPANFITKTVTKTAKKIKQRFHYAKQRRRVKR